jgi:toxin ParE1/3/4
MKRARFSRRSHLDLIEIGEYIARDNPAAATRLLDRLDEACHRLAGMPTLGFPHDDLPDDLLAWRGAAI